MKTAGVLRFMTSAALGTAAAGLGSLTGRYIYGRRRVDREWAAARYEALDGSVGAVAELTVLPLIDWVTPTAQSDQSSTAGEENQVDDGKLWAGEPGVSYLLKADDTTLLFDMGFNEERAHPSPLLRNMDRAGVTWDDIDILAFSHAHPDHLGGSGHALAHTFGPSGETVDLGGKIAYVPEPLANPSAQSVLVNGPRVLAPGVASLGPIPRQLFFDGYRREQSLAVSVVGKGIVVIVGCGHSTIQRILARAEMLFSQPIYGVIGGLHFPVTQSRMVKFGIPVQRFVGTGKWPWDPINEKDVQAAIQVIKGYNPTLVSLSPHDSCDWSLHAFRDAFGDAYHELRVGHPIVIQGESVE